jgi:hypothetical protein
MHIGGKVKVFLVPYKQCGNTDAKNLISSIRQKAYTPMIGSWVGLRATFFTVIKRIVQTLL